MEDLFNLNPDDFTGKSSASQYIDTNIFNPSPDQGQNGVYKAIIRFIPWAVNPKQSKYKKYTARLTNPLTNERLALDCPSTTGAPSILWSIDLMLRDLKDSEPQIYDEIKRYFNRYYNYYSPIYIKRDPQVLDYEGQIKIYSFGYSIDNLIQQELSPPMSELITTQPKINPYSLTEGKDFVLVVKRKTKQWRDYSSSKFMTEVSPLIIEHNGKEIPITNDPKSAAFAKKFLTENTPDLSQYFLKPWTEEEYAKVATFVKAIVPYKQLLDNLVSGIKDDKLKAHFVKSDYTPVSETIIRDAAPSGESLLFNPDGPDQRSTANTSMTDNIFDEPKTISKIDDDLDNLFDDL